MTLDFCNFFNIYGQSELWSIRGGDSPRDKKFHGLTQTGVGMHRHPPWHGNFLPPGDPEQWEMTGMSLGVHPSIPPGENTTAWCSGCKEKNNFLLWTWRTQRFMLWQQHHLKISGLQLWLGRAWMSDNKNLGIAARIKKKQKQSACLMVAELNLQQEAQGWEVNCLSCTSPSAGL